MSWLVYSVFAVTMSFFIAKLKKRYFFEIFFFLIIFFLTPSQIEAFKSDYAPSLYAFIFNTIFQQDLSIRVLKPLLLSLLLYAALLLIYLAFKKKFF